MGVREIVRIALARGDGRAPEMMAVATDLVAHGAKLDDKDIEWIETPMGWCAFERYGDTLPSESYAAAYDVGILYFGGVGDTALDKTLGAEHPDMMPEAHCLLPIRKRWGLLHNRRPINFYPELRGVARVRPETIPDTGVRQEWVRYGLQDTYFGNADLMEDIPLDVRKHLGIKAKKDVTGQEARVTDLGYYSRDMLLKYFPHVFQLARELDLPVICIDKRNVEARYEFWRKIFDEVHKKDFSEIPVRYLYADSACEALFEPYKLHGLIACGNAHGDMLSDGAAKSVGSMGLMCSSSINIETGKAMFESGAGTACNLDEDVASPIGRTLAGALMLRHIRCPKGADVLPLSIRRVLQKGYRTADLVVPGEDVKVVGTAEMGRLIKSEMDAA